MSVSFSEFVHAVLTSPTPPILQEHLTHLTKHEQARGASSGCAAGFQFLPLGMMSTALKKPGQTGRKGAGSAVSPGSKGKGKKG